jgi:cytochrome c5
VNGAVAKIILLFLIFGCGYFAAAQTGQPAQIQTAKKGQAHAGNASDGEQRFRTNCGRCHNPPEDISPREARAVIRQMRVRAMLSAEDEKLILEYIAP